MLPNDVREAIEAIDSDIDRDMRLGGSLSSILIPWDVLKGWLDAQPQAPQPDWDNAPAEANWWIVHSDGLEEWWCIKNDGYPYADGSSWEVSGAHWADGTWRPCGSGRKHNIDIGIDWRTLKQRREG